MNMTAEEYLIWLRIVAMTSLLVVASKKDKKTVDRVVIKRKATR